ncbi:hypothetical protein NECID01_2159 [Nematocida sp. AWRm77]|nr:hypothetical protein NECID01_2159 [Nematocida sp. AWRm77]
MFRTLLVIGRNFRPITPFVSVYLVEEKGFATREIVEKIIPWWLYAMLMCSLMIPVVVDQIGVLHTIVLSVCMEILGGAMLLYMPKRCVPATVFAEMIIAFRSSVIVADKAYYGEKDCGKTVRYSTIRKVTGIVSSFISQSMYHISGSSVPSVYLTMLSQAMVLCTTLLLHDSSEKKVASPFTLEGVSAGLVSKIFSYIGAFTLMSCFKIYIDLVLIDRSGNIGELEGVLGMLLDKVSFVFYLISLGIVKILSKITKTVQVQPRDHTTKALHGYLEGITKIVGVGLAIPLVHRAGEKFIYTEILCITSWYMQILGMNALKNSTTILGGYASYLLSFLGSSITLYISYNRINTLSDDRIITIMSYIGGISCGVHALIDVISRKKKIKPEQRFALYARLGISLFVAALLCSCIEYYQIWKEYTSQQK